MVAAGRVVLVGAGPGAADLLTLRGLRALQAADLVLHDALIGPDLLALVPPGTRRVAVGKRCGRHSVRQAAINQILVREARAGRLVVRLKGGDPLIFGRAGEELAALAAAGIAVEIIPGVTAASAAAASLGVTLTDRAEAHALHFITGHGREGGAPAHAYGAMVAAGGTIAAYMAGARLAELAADLLAAGMSPATPAVAVENASLPEQRHFAAPIGDLPARLAAAAPEGPILVLIGAVTRAALAMAEHAARVA